jgi:hypothetical protein
MNETNEIKKAAVIAAASEQVRALLETHYDAMRKAAEESFVDDETQAEPKAKASFTIEWDALAMAPTVTVKVGWSVRFKDESEAVVDPLQAKLPMGGVE